jgi:hypothetical protein
MFNLKIINKELYVLDEEYESNFMQDFLVSCAGGHMGDTDIGGSLLKIGKDKRDTNKQFYSHQIANYKPEPN